MDPEIKNGRRLRQQAILEGLFWAAVLAVGSDFIGSDREGWKGILFTMAIAFPGFVLYNASFSQDITQQLPKASASETAARWRAAALLVLAIDAGAAWVYAPQRDFPGFLEALSWLLGVQLAVLILLDVIVEYIRRRRWPVPSLDLFFYRK